MPVIVYFLAGLCVGVAFNVIMDKAVVKSKDMLLAKKEELISTQKRYISALEQGIMLRDNHISRLNRIIASIEPTEELN